MATEKTTTTTTFVQSLKNQWIAVLLVILFIIFMLSTGSKGCNNPFFNRGDTLSDKTKTVNNWITLPTQTVKEYVPTQTGGTVYVPIPQDRQASTDLAELTKQYNEVVKELLATRKYDDKTILKDSAGNEVGYFQNHDVVSENKIQTRAPEYQLKYLHTTTTRTVTIEEQRRQLSAGGGLILSQTAFVNGGYVGLDYKNKRGQLFDLNVGVQKFPSGPTQFFGQIGTKFPIKFKFLK